MKLEGFGENHPVLWMQQSFKCNLLPLVGYYG